MVGTREVFVAVPRGCCGSCGPQPVHRCLARFRPARSRRKPCPRGRDPGVELHRLGQRARRSRLLGRRPCHLPLAFLDAGVGARLASGRSRRDQSCPLPGRRRLHQRTVVLAYLRQHQATCQSSTRSSCLAAPPRIPRARWCKATGTTDGTTLTGPYFWDPSRRKPGRRYDGSHGVLEVTG